MSILWVWVVVGGAKISVENLLVSREWVISPAKSPQKVNRAGNIKKGTRRPLVPTMELGYMHFFN